MNSPENELLNKVDALVAAQLAGQAAEIDGEAGLRRVRAGLEVRPAAPRRPWFRWALAGATAAAVFVAFLGGRYTGPAPVNAQELVREVKHVHNLSLERCYLVEMRPLADDAADAKPLRQVRVWTAGDRFWVEAQHPAAAPFVWGRAENGSLWAVLDAQRGVRVSAEQAPKPLSVVADLYGLNVDALLGNVLHDCTLTEAAGESTKLTRVVTAEPSGERARLWLEKAILEIDTETKVLRRLIIHRNRLGAPLAQLTFSLVDTQPRDDAKYQLEGHLTAPFRVVEGTIPPRVKLELVARWLGVNGGKKNPIEPAEKEFTFTDIEGRPHTPLANADKKASVLLFLLTDCPISNSYAPEIARLCKEYEAKQIAFFVVHADPDVTAEQAKKHAKDYGLPCPVLCDPAHLLVKRTGVTMAPEAAVVGPTQRVLYCGRIDDWYAGLGKRRPEPTQRDLRLALEAIVRGDDVPNATTKAIGCYLPEPRK
jgi:peroxiredoxin